MRISSHCPSRSTSRSLVAVCATAFLLISLNHAAAQRVPFNHPDGKTHWYEVFEAPTGTTWSDANNVALQLRGHLVTVTAQEENTFLFHLINDPAYWTPDPAGGQIGPWMGGVQPPGSPEPAGNWKWVNGEPFGYSAWWSTQPDNLGGNEDRICFGSSLATRVSYWSDRDKNDASPRGYIVEWDWPPDQTVGLFQNDSAAFDGYTLLSPQRAPQSTGATQYDEICLIDNAGRVVHSWDSAHLNGFAPYLLDNGDLLRLVNNGNNGWAGGAAGKVEQLAWDGTVVWEYVYEATDYITHHDLELLPNGNILMIAWEKKTVAEAIAAGRDPNVLAYGALWPDMIIEVAPVGSSGGVIVWKWHLWDHLIQDLDPTKNNYGVVANHPELVDVNYTIDGSADWNHSNSIHYNAQLDQIVISVRAFSEIWVIDHSTTMLEAAGHTGGNSGKGGDLLYRWGNPQVYQAGTPADKTLFFQHDARWIEPGLPGAGNILIFSNGNGRPGGNASSVDEITPPVDGLGNYTLVPGTAYGPSTTTWSYAAVNPTDWFSFFMSGAQRLPNGNTLICSSANGTLFEVTTAGETVWRYVNPMAIPGMIEQGEPAFLCCNQVFRAERYASSHPGLQGKALIPGDPIEPYPLEVEARFGSVNLGNASRTDVLFANGSAGDIWRREYVSSSSNLTMSIEAPPAGPNPAHFALYIVPYEPGLGDLRMQPANIGLSCMTMPLSSGLPVAPQFTLVNSMGAGPPLGTPLIPGMPPAPTLLFSAPLPPMTFTLQGYIFDLGAAGVFASVTNAIVVNVY